MMLVANNVDGVASIQKMVNSGQQIQQLQGLGWTQNVQNQYYNQSLEGRAMNEQLDGRNIVDVIKMNLSQTSPGVAPTNKDIANALTSIAKSNGYSSVDELYSNLALGNYAGGKDLYQVMVSHYANIIDTGGEAALPEVANFNKTGSRPLTPSEKMLAKLTYGFNFDADSIILKPNSNNRGGVNNSFTIDDTIRLSRNVIDFRTGKPKDLATLMHELGHSAQYQAENSSMYISTALSDYILPWRDDPYDYQLQMQKSNYYAGSADGARKFSQMRPDGQAELPANLFDAAYSNNNSKYSILSLYRKDWAQRSYQIR
jgi:hypothetical protein